MNKIYKVIWNTQLGCWQAVSELAKNHSTAQSALDTPKSVSGMVQKISGLILFGLALLPLSIHAAISNTELPTGAQINSGSASFNQNNNTLNINQNSQNLSTHWNTFNIGKDATVNFNQPNQSSTAINHVLDSNASQIMGRLNANGQVFLLNPNGVVFSKTAQVNVGGLVASTLTLNDADIQNGKYTLKGGANSTATIENQGAIQTLQGGTVALIAPNVKNTGTITTPNGTTHLTSASQVTLALQDGTLTQYQVDLGVLQGLVDNSGAIIADNGAVYLTAKAKDSLSKAVINHSGIIEANRLTQNAKGEIILLGDMQFGETIVSGMLKAEGKNGQNGGFIETSAAHVEIAADTKVSTASDTAKSGLWLIDPVDITIDSAKAAAIQTALNSGDVTVTTANSAANSWGTNGTATDKGDIHVNSAINWSTNQALTLRADNDININADITATGATGKLNLKYGQSTVNGGTSDYYLQKGAKVNLKAGQNFSTQKGSDGINLKNYQVLTELGAQGSTTSQDLQGINGNLNDNYVLGADINASTTSGWNSGKGFNTIGTSRYYFSGVFDGLGHIISDLVINDTSNNFAALFSLISKEAEIKNIGLLAGNVSGGWSAGSLVGHNLGKISNAYATTKVSSDNIGTTQNKATSTAGGLAGSNDGIIKNSYATGSVSASNTAETTESASFAGGLVGYNTGVIENSYATGSVSSFNTANSSKDISFTSNMSYSYAGGLSGYNSGKMSNIYATGKVVATSKSNSVKTYSHAGGLVGRNMGLIHHAYATGSVSGSASSKSLSKLFFNSYIGGLVGSTDKNSEIHHAYATGKITSEVDPAHENHAGGLVGMNLGLINISYASGDILTDTVANYRSVGGLVGSNYGEVSNSYAVGDVVVSGAKWSQYAGGLIGNSSDFTAGSSKVSNVYALGKVSVASDLVSGGLMGSSSTPVENGYWNIDISGQDKGVGNGTTQVKGLTTTQMFTMGKGGLDGFDVTVWGNADNQTTPYLLNMANNQVFNKNDLPTGVITSTNRPTLYTAILNVNQLQNMNQNLSGKYLLGNNIDASDTVNWNSGAGFSPIGNSSNKFNGQLDGLGHSIDNLNIKLVNTGVTKDIGLFGYIGKDGVVHELGLSNVQMSLNNSTSGGYVTNLITMGALAGHSEGTIYNVFSTGNVSAKNETGIYYNSNSQTNVGGLIGRTSGTSKLSNAYSTATVLSFAQTNHISANAFAYAGGLVGYQQAGSISNAYATGNVESRNATNNTGSISAAGGLVGAMDSGAIATSYASNMPKAETYASNRGERYTGGLIGVGNGGTVENSYWDAAGAALAKGVGNTLVTGSAGLTSEEMKDPAKFNGFDIDDQGGTGKIWRIYKGQTSPLLRNFLTLAPLNAADQIAIYNGQKQGLGTSIFTGLNSNNILSSLSSSKNVGNYNLSYYSNQQGYDFLGKISANLLINKAIINAVTGITANNKTYDGTTGTSLNAGSAGFTGMVAGDNLTVATSTANFSDKNAGTGKTVNITDLSLGGTDAGNYDLQSTTASAQANINKAAISAITGISANHKTYDGTSTASLNAGSAGFTGIVAGDNLTVATSTANFSDKNAGTGKTVNITGLSLGGTDAGNYVLASNTASNTASITAKTLTATINAQNKVYDAGTSANVSYGDDRLGTDQITVSGTASFADKNVGTGKTVTANGLSLSGADAGNYVLASNTASNTASITAKTLTATINAQNKVYDAGTSANVSYGDDRLGTDQITVSGTASFADKNVGTVKTVTANGLSLSGADAGNYVLASNTASNTASITAKTLTATINAQNKVYDAGTSANVSYGDDRLGTDQITVSGIASFADKNVGTVKTVTANGLSLSGADAGNYVLASNTASNTASITAKTLTATINAQNKVYDAGTSANVSYGDDRLGTDQITVSGIASFADKNVGTVKTVTANGLSLSGADAGNYVLASNTASNTASITAKTLTATINAQNKVYDAGTSANVSYGDDRLGTDQITVSGTASFADKNVGTGKTVTANGLSLSGADAGNYVLASNTASNTASITAKTLTATINAQNKVYDAGTSANVSYGDDRLGTDQITVSGTASFADKNVGTVKTVTANGLSLSGADAGNYVLASNTASNTASITAKTLTATINAQNKVYDAGTSANVSYGDDRLGTDQITVSGIASFADKNVGTVKTVTANGLSLSGADAGNYVLASNTASNTASITAKTLTATINAQNKVYDAGTSANVSYGDDRLGTDQITVSGTASFADKNVGTGKTVTANGLSLSGADAGNYVLASNTASNTASITAKTLTATINAQNKVYDAGTSANVSYGDDRLGTDQITVSGTASFADKNVGTGKTVTANGLSLSGADAGNYVLASTSVADKADITARTLNVTADAQNRIYDGTTTANVSFGDDRIAKDRLNITGASSFADKNAGTGKTVTSTGLSLSGADAGNYVLASTMVTDTADIAKAQISQVAGITANNRVYDASIDVVLDSSLVQFDGMVAGDELLVDTASGQFSDKNVGSAKKVSISGISLTGADAHNYELVSNTAQTTADITKANIGSITGITADNRSYNGLTTVSLNSSNAQFNGIYTGDELVVATATGQFDNAVTGQAKTVSITGLSLGGVDAGNYNLVDTTALTTADISMLTPAAYLQAIQFKRPRYLPETQNALNTANLEVRQGGVNTTGIQTLAGEH